jgi:hypothetical protein
MWVLRVLGSVVLLALPAALLPVGWMNALHRSLGMGELPKAPIVEYLSRSCSLLYAMHGALLLFVSFDVRRYLGAIRFLAWAGLVFAAGMLWVDLAAGMPSLWTWSEGPIIAAESILILWLARRAQQRPE